MDQQSHHVSGFVGAGHVSRLVLDPDAAIGPEPEPGRELLGAPQRSHFESAAVHRRHLFVQGADEVDVVLVGHPASGRELPRVEETPIADEGNGIVVNEVRPAESPWFEDPGHHVIEVVSGSCVGAPERKEIVVGEGGPAPGAHHGAGRSDHSASSTPVRALNSSIMPSHDGTISRSSFQNCWSLRTMNSSNSTPCCSTHVKYPRLKMRWRSASVSSSR